MLPDIGWFELLVVVGLAIIVVGPKDLPRLMRTMGRWAGKAQKMAMEFRHSFDDMVRETELDDLRAQVDELKKSNPLADIEEALDPSKELGDLDSGLKSDMNPKARTPEAGGVASEAEPASAIGDLGAVADEAEKSAFDSLGDQDDSHSQGSVKP